MIQCGMLPAFRLELIVITKLLNKNKLLVLIDQEKMAWATDIVISGIHEIWGSTSRMGRWEVKTMRW